MMQEGNTPERRKAILVGTIDYRIIEDLNRRLNRDDFDVRFVQKGVHLLTEILDNDIDLLILDLDLAGVMGVEMLPVIRRLRPRLPVILLSDDFTSKIRQTAAELGITYQAFKSVNSTDTDEIVSATEKIIEKRTLAQVH